MPVPAVATVASIPASAPGAVSIPTIVSAPPQNAPVASPVVAPEVSKVVAPQVVAQTPQLAAGSLPASSTHSLPDASPTPQGVAVPPAVVDPATVPQVAQTPQIAKTIAESTVPSAVSAPPAVSAPANVVAAADPQLNPQVVAAADPALAPSQATAPNVVAVAPSADAVPSTGAMGDSSKSLDPNIQATLQPVDQASAVPLAAEQPSAWWITFSAQFPQAAHFAESGSFAMVVKGLCMASNILVQVSPYTQVRRWEIMGDTGEADAAPFVSIGFSGWQWCFYGIFAWLLTKRSGFLILVHSNFLGALLGTYYTIAFYRYCRSKACSDSLQRYLSASMTLALLQVCALFVLPSDRALFLSGLVSSFCSFVGAASMLVIVPAVVRCKDSSLIPGPFAVASLGSSLVWALCGWMLDDPLVIGPNIFSMFASLVTLYCKWQYPSIASKDSKDGVDCADPFEAAIVAQTTPVPIVPRHQEPRGTVFTRKRPSRKSSLPLIPEDTKSSTTAPMPLPNDIPAPAVEHEAAPTSESEVDSIGLRVDEEEEALQTPAPEIVVVDAAIALSTSASPRKASALLNGSDGTGGTF